MNLGDLKQLFGTAIKSKRSELGISQEELADRAGLHRTYVSDVERGARNLSLESIEKLAAALDLSISGLFERASDPDTVKQEVEILLVEDMPRDIELTQRAFNKAKFINPLHVVRDGPEALDFLTAGGAYAYRRELRLPDVVLLDLNLPKLSGIEVLQKIKADPRTRGIPVVILTASQDVCDAAACRALGAQAYIVKPVNFQNFSEVTPQLRFEWALVKRPVGEAE
jgi:CheY-like chemotaxis protein/DNA-binding Xre family transcriptional regulator